MKTYLVEWAYAPTSYSPLNVSSLTADDLWLESAEYNRISIRADRHAHIQKVYVMNPDGSRILHYENTHMALVHKLSSELRAAVKPKVADVWADDVVTP